MFNIQAIEDYFLLAGSYIIILFVFLGAAAGGILVMFLNFGDELEMAKSELRKTIRYYKVDQRHSVATLFWDNVQPGLGCCGAEKWEDWKEARPAVLKPGMKVIDKCCKPGNDDCTFNEPTDESIYIQVKYRIIRRQWGRGQKHENLADVVPKLGKS